MSAWRVFEINWDSVREPTPVQRAGVEQELLQERDHYVEQLLLRLRPFIRATAELLIADLLSMPAGKA
jgi:hypothetical protein